MQIHELRSKFKVQKKKRVGRGGKRGTTSGKGQKGQKSRSGHRIRPAERDIISKLPKLRGVKNQSKIKPETELDVRSLAKLAVNGLVNKKILLEKGIIKRISEKVKVLSNGEVTGAITLEGIQVSAGAKAKIEKAGGKVMA
ncbi:50S ribosomal protein L15 [bacterium]|nr:MAG: 50S ribosomal protein L15 [bacterium]